MFKQVIALTDDIGVLSQFLLMTVLSFIPFAPIPVVATVIAANHSFFISFCINFGSTIMASVILYALSSKFLKRFATNQMQRSVYTQHFAKLIEAKPFVAIFITRLIPIVPSLAINCIAGAFRVNFLTFLYATMLGKLPSILMYCFTGQQIGVGNWYAIGIILLFMLIIAIASQKLRRLWIVHEVQISKE